MAAAPPEKSPKPGLNIYGIATVNPYKLTIATRRSFGRFLLPHMSWSNVVADGLSNSVPYNYTSVDLAAGETQTEWYTAINPNERLPAIVHVKEDGTSVSVFESAACLLYIASEFDKEHKISYPYGAEGYWTQLSWLSWQVAGYGPMMGQACHFNRYAAEPVPYGSWRYTAESRRLNQVLDNSLTKTNDLSNLFFCPSAHPFVAGDRLTVADMAVFVYAHSARWCGVDINEFPHVKEWHDKLVQRPAFARGLLSPTPFPFRDEAVTDPDGQDYYKALRKMGGQMMKMASDQWKRDVPAVPSDHANYA